MKLSARLTVIVIIWWLPLSAPALDNNTAVKVTPLIKTTSSWDGRPIVYPDGQAEVTVLMVEIAPGGETGWHYHKVPSFGIVLEGTLEVTLKDGRVKRLKACEGLAEVVDTLHNGRNVGNDPVKIVVFYTGAAGLGLTVKDPVATSPPP